MIEANEHGMMKRLLEADETLQSVAIDLEGSIDYPGSTTWAVTELQQIRVRLRRVLLSIETATRPHVPDEEG